MEHLLSHPLTSLFVTLGAFSLANVLHKKSGGHPLTTPILVAIGLVVIYILISGIGYDAYMEGGRYIHFFLGTAIVAMALPIHAQLGRIRAQTRAMLAGLVVGFVLAFSAFVIAGWMQADPELQHAMLPKSVTTPIAIGIAEKIGLDPPLVVFTVMLTAVLGVLLGPPLLTALRIRDPRARGFAIGVVCHGVGAAQAFQEGETQGVYAVLGMSLMGLVSGVLLPVVVLMAIS